MPERVARYVPITQWLPRYERSFLGADLLAGLAVWAVLVPQAVAYAALAGAPPEAGLFAALAAGVAYAVFGTCRELDVGPSSTIAITAAAALATVAAKFPAQDYATLLAALALLTGRRARRGRRCCGSDSSRSSSPARCSIGFISGIGVVIIVGQLPKLLGLHGRERQRARDALADVGALDELGWETPVVGVGALVALLVLRRLAPRVPWALARRRRLGRRSAAPSTSRLTASP